MLLHICSVWRGCWRERNSSCTKSCLCECKTFSWQTHKPWTCAAASHRRPGTAVKINSHIASPSSILSLSLWVFSKTNKLLISMHNAHLILFKYEMKNIFHINYEMETALHAFKFEILSREKFLKKFQTSLELLRLSKEILITFTTPWAWTFFLFLFFLPSSTFFMRLIFLISVR